MQYWISEATEAELKKMKYSLMSQVFKQLKFLQGSKKVDDDALNESFDKLYDMSISNIEGVIRELDSRVKKVAEERLHPEIKWKRQKIEKLAKELNETHTRLKDFKKYNEDKAIMMPLEKHEVELLKEWCKLTGKAYFPYEPK